MAADGSLKFDTKIDTSNFDASVSTLEKALDRLSKSVDKLSNNIIKRFSGVQAAAEDISGGTKTAAKGVEEITDAMKRAEQEAQDLQKQMEKIQVHEMEEVKTEPVPEKRVPIENAAGYGYDKSAMEFIEQYGKKTEEASVQLNEFRQEIEGLQGEIKKLESQGLYFGDEEYDETYLALKQVQQALADYKKELLSPTPDANPFGVDTLSGKIMDLQIQLQKLAESGKGLGNAEYDELYRKLAIAKEAAKDYAAELAKTPKMVERENQLLAAAQARLDARIAKEQQLLQAQLAKSAQEAIEKQRLEEIASAAQVSSGKVVELRQELERLNARQADLKAAGLGLGHQEFDANVVKIADINAQLSKYKNELTQDAEQTSMFAAVVRRAFGIAGSAVAGFGSKLGSQLTGDVKRAVSGLKSLLQPANKASKCILKLSNMLKLMVIRMAMQAAIQGVRDGMKNLVQYSSEANQTVSSLMSGMTYLKNSFAAAFSPILTIVAPALNTLISLLATALNYINQFFATLGGSTTFVQAKKVNEDYAKSIKSAGGAAKQAGEDAKKALAPFDELTVLQEQASSGSGGGGGGADPSQMFETVTIDDAVNGFAEQIRQAFEAGDWKELGTLIGNKFNEIVDGIDWSGMGHKIGAGINGAVQTAYYALKEADFVNLGNHVAELLNGALEEIDFTFVGRLLVRGFTAGLDFLIGLLGGLNWGLVGQSVGDFLRGAFEESYDWITGIGWSQMAHSLYSNIKDCLLGVDFSSLAESFFKMLGAALGAAVSFVASFVGDIWNDITGYFSDYLTNDDGTKKCGKEWVAGILDGILDAIVGIGTWIWEHVAQPLIQGFKDAFGIHSPSTVMAELGGYLMEGLLNKITEMMPNVVSKFGELKESISQKWDEIKAATSEKWTGIQSDLSGLWNGLKENAGTVFGELGDGVKKVWEDVKTNTKTMWEQGGITGVVSGSVNAIISSVETMVNQVIRAINGLISGINLLSIDIPDTPFSEGFTLGFNIPSLSEVYLPRLATGTVVPPRAGEFAAILGDNNREAEVVSPISTMKQAFREILEEMQGMFGGDIYLTVELDGKVAYENVVKRNQMTKKQTGKNPLLV